MRAAAGLRLSCGHELRDPAEDRGKRQDDPHVQDSGAMAVRRTTVQLVANNVRPTAEQQQFVASAQDAVYLMDGYDQLARSLNVTIVPLDAQSERAAANESVIAVTRDDVFSEQATPEGARRHWACATQVRNPWVSHPVSQGLLQRWTEVRAALLIEVEHLGIDEATLKRRCGRVHRALVSGSSMDRDNAKAAVEQAATLVRSSLRSDASDVCGALLEYVICTPPLQ